jgi:hypothetical protein
MSCRDHLRALLGISISFVLGTEDLSFAQSGVPTNSAPHPYRSIDGSAKCQKGGPGARPPVSISTRTGRA